MAWIKVTYLQRKQASRIIQRELRRAGKLATHLARAMNLPRGYIHFAENLTRRHDNEELFLCPAPAILKIIRWDEELGKGKARKPRGRVARAHGHEEPCQSTSRSSPDAPYL